MGASNSRKNKQVGPDPSQGWQFRQRFGVCGGVMECRSRPIAMPNRALRVPKDQEYLVKRCDEFFKTRIDKVGWQIVEEKNWNRRTKLAQIFLPWCFLFSVLFTPIGAGIGNVGLLVTGIIFCLLYVSCFWMLIFRYWPGYIESTKKFRQIVADNMGQWMQEYQMQFGELSGLTAGLAKSTERVTHFAYLHSPIPKWYRESIEISVLFTGGIWYALAMLHRPIMKWEPNDRDYYDVEVTFNPSMREVMVITQPSMVPQGMVIQPQPMHFNGMNMVHSQPQPQPQQQIGQMPSMVAGQYGQQAMNPSQQPMPGMQYQQQYQQQQSMPVQMMPMQMGMQPMVQSHPTPGMGMYPPMGYPGQSMIAPGSVPPPASTSSYPDPSPMSTLEFKEGHEGKPDSAPVAYGGDTSEVPPAYAGTSSA